MSADRRSHPEKVKQSRLHVNCLVSQRRGSRETALASAQIILADGKHAARAADGGADWASGLNMTLYKHGTRTQLPGF